MGNNPAVTGNGKPEMNFRSLAQLSSLLSKSFAEDFFRLLLAYRTISASEAASRLNLHIKTAQDFLEGLERLGVISKREVLEKKRPYFRYTLEHKMLRIEFDLNLLKTDMDRAVRLDEILVREKKNAGAVFKTSPKTGALTTVTFFMGKVRARIERKIHLTENQGKFLFHLPFPTEEPLSMRAILDRAKIEPDFEAEVLDMVRFLSRHGIIEIKIKDS